MIVQLGTSATLACQYLELSVEHEFCIVTDALANSFPISRWFMQSTRVVLCVLLSGEWQMAIASALEILLPAGCCILHITSKWFFTLQFCGYIQMYNG